MTRYDVRASSQLGTIAVIDTIAQEICREWPDTPANRSEALAYRDELAELDRTFNASQHSAESFARLIRATVN